MAADDNLKKYLQEEFPKATEAECQRFAHHARGTTLGLGIKNKRIAEHQEHVVQGKAKEAMQEYLDWRTQYGLDQESEVPAAGATDAEVWKWAVTKAASNNTSLELDQIPFRILDDTTGNAIVDKEKRPIFQILGARMDPDATDAHTYGMAFALYIDRYFDRHKNDTGTLMLDVRAGHGWKNPPFTGLISYIGTFIDMCANKYHPGRCASLIFYPLPGTVTTAVEGITSMLPKELQHAVVTVAGPAGSDSPLPKHDLIQYVDESVLDTMEANRDKLCSDETE